jgi:sec-independent protein translocase protein TatA
VIGDIFQPTHLLFLLVIVLLVLGPKRLPEMARSLGRGFRDFRDAISGENHPSVHELHQQPIASNPGAPAAEPFTASVASEPEPMAATAYSDLEPVTAPAAPAPESVIPTTASAPERAATPAPPAPDPTPVLTPHPESAESPEPEPVGSQVSKAQDAG